MYPGMLKCLLLDWFDGCLFCFHPIVNRTQKLLKTTAEFPHHHRSAHYLLFYFLKNGWTFKTWHHCFLYLQGKFVNLKCYKKKHEPQLWLDQMDEAAASRDTGYFPTHPIQIPVSLYFHRCLLQAPTLSSLQRVCAAAQRPRVWLENGHNLSQMHC